MRGMLCGLRPFIRQSTLLSPLLFSRAIQTRSLSSSQEDVWLCKPGLENPLINDLKSLSKAHGALQFSITQKQKGVVVSKGASPEMYDKSAWASQVLQSCSAVQADSVRVLAKESGNLLVKSIKDIEKESPLDRILVHGLANIDSGLRGRCSLVKEHLLAHLKKSQRRTFKLISPDLSNLSIKIPPPPPKDKEIEATSVQPSSAHIGVVQLFLVNQTTLLISTSTTTRVSGQGWQRPFPWDGGLAALPTPPESKAPPSRAYQKLDEIFAVLGDQPKPRMTVVDLGSAPGGWTHRLANDMKCKVLSVDRTPLDPHLEQNKNIKHIIADGSVWLPPKKVDWLFCDMALPALKSVEVLSKWVEGKWCKKFVWTIKFVGTAHYEAVLERVRALLSNHHYSIRHLPSIHGNEIVILGRTAPKEQGTVKSSNEYEE